MVDKSLASQTGVAAILENIAFGEARYGERIFDQKSNLIQKAIMLSDRTLHQKKYLLGEHIFDELKTHSDLGGKSNIKMRQAAFATGDEVNPANKIKTSPAMKKKVEDFQEKYNAWARQNNQPVIKKDGMYGQETENAISNWNLNNPITEAYSIKTGTTINPKTGSKTKTLSGLDYQFAEKVRNPEMMLNTDPLNPEIDTKLDENFAQLNANLANGTAPIVPTVPAAATDKAKPTITPEERRTMFGNLADLATAGIGALNAQTKIPRYKPTDDYTDMYNQIKSQRNQGFTPEEQAAINQGLQGNYATNVETIRNLTGGGGTAGAVLSSLGAASNQLDNSYLQASLQNIDQRRQNQSRYQNAVIQDLNMDQQIFEQDRNNAIAQKQAGLTLLSQSRNNINQRMDYNRAYGEGSIYDTLQRSMVAGTLAQNQKAESQVELLRRYMNGQINQPK